MKDLKNIAFKDMYCNTTKNYFIGRSNKIKCLIWNPPVQLTGRALLFLFSLDDSPGRHLNLVNFEKVLQAKAKVGVISEKHFHYLQNVSLMHIIYQANSSLKIDLWLRPANVRGAVLDARLRPQLRDWEDEVAHGGQLTQNLGSLLPNLLMKCQLNEGFKS